MNKLLTLILISIVLGCSMKNNSLEVEYSRGGKTYTDHIAINSFISEEGNLQTNFIKQITFEVLDSACFIDNNPDKLRFNSTPVELDYTKPIKKYTPEYYTLTTAFYIDKTIQYYNRLFDDRIDFNQLEEYRNIKILQGNYGLFCHPNQYILEDKQLFSPSIFYHEMGHVAFWILEDDLGLKFKGLSTLHMGLLEYFTVSLYDYPIVGELVLKKLERDASISYSYPQPDSMKMRRTFELMKECFPKVTTDTSSFESQYYRLSLQHYDKYLDLHVDNHRGGFLYTSTLWRIREQIGQEKTDKLVAQTILDLNSFMDQRNAFYMPDIDEEMKDKLMWYDLLYGLIKKDETLFEGQYKSVILNEFKNSHFPIGKINLTSDIEI